MSIKNQIEPLPEKGLFAAGRSDCGASQLNGFGNIVLRGCFVCDAALSWL